MKSLSHVARTGLLALACLGGLAAAAPSAQGQAASGAPTDQPTVSVNDFRSALAEVSSPAALDIFTKALVESGRFRVVERAQLDPAAPHGVPANLVADANGSGTLSAARAYLFEGTVTEVNAGQQQKQGAISFGGLSIGGGHSDESLAVEIRISDPASGRVLDVVSVRKTLKVENVSAGGTAAFAGTIASLMGRTISPLTPNVSAQSSKKASVEKTLRACIDDAVLELARRLPGATLAHTT